MLPCVEQLGAPDRCSSTVTSERWFAHESNEPIVATLVGDRRSAGGDDGNRRHCQLCRTRRPGYWYTARANAAVARVARLALREPAAACERHLGRDRYPVQARPPRCAPLSAHHGCGRAGPLRDATALRPAGHLAVPLDHAARD